CGIRFGLATPVVTMIDRGVGKFQRADAPTCMVAQAASLSRYGAEKHGNPEIPSCSAEHCTMRPCACLNLIRRCASKGCTHGGHDFVHMHPQPPFNEL